MPAMKLSRKVKTKTTTSVMAGKNIVGMTRSNVLISSAVGQTD